MADKITQIAQLISGLSYKEMLELAETLKDKIDNVDDPEEVSGIAQALSEWAEEEKVGDED